jgi:PKD repeat protein
VSAGGVDVLDLTVIRVAAEGPAVSVTAGGETRLQRLIVASAGQGVVLNSNAVGERRLTVDSTAVNSTGGPAFSVTTGLVSGNAFLTLNHVTAAKGAAAVALQAGTALTSGDITFAARASILHGASTADAGTPLGGTVTATYTNSDATAMTGDATSQDTATPDDQLFGEGLLLKAGAPVIDKGGQPAQGESATDVQGDARQIGEQTDIGADEYINHAPKLNLAVDPAAPDVDQTVTATATATDLEGASDLATYHISWGDGGPIESGTGRSFTHAYSKPGEYTVTMTVVDRTGAAAEPATQTVKVVDDQAPQVQVTNPKEGATVALSGARRTFAVKGVWADGSGVEKIEVALTRRTGGCAHFDGRTLKRQGCKQPIFVPTVLKGPRFQLKTPALKFKPGTYQVKVRATDTLGNVTTGFTKAAGTLVTFKVS